MKEEAGIHREILEDRIIMQEEAPASKADTILAGTFMDQQILISGYPIQGRHGGRFGGQ
jgi:hypothetical protein